MQASFRKSHQNWRRAVAAAAAAADSGAALEKRSRKGWRRDADGDDDGDDGDDDAMLQKRSRKGWRRDVDGDDNDDDDDDDDGDDDNGMLERRSRKGWRREIPDAIDDDEDGDDNDDDGDDDAMLERRSRKGWRRDSKDNNNYYYPSRSPTPFPQRVTAPSASPTPTSTATPTPTSTAAPTPSPSAPAGLVDPNLLDGLTGSRSPTPSPAKQAGGVVVGDAPVIVNDTPLNQTPSPTPSVSPTPALANNAYNGSKNMKDNDDAFPLSGIMGITVAGLVFFVVVAILVFVYYKKKLNAKVVLSDASKKTDPYASTYEMTNPPPYHDSYSAPQYSAKQDVAINMPRMVPGSRVGAKPGADAPAFGSVNEATMQQNGNFYRTSSNASATKLIAPPLTQSLRAPRRPSLASSASSDQAYMVPNPRLQVPSQPTLLSSSTLINTNREYALPGFLLMDLDNSLRLGRHIGQGGAADVYEAVLIDPAAKERVKIPDSRVAVKFLKECATMTPEENRFCFEQEVSILWSLGYHPHIAKLIGYCNTPRFMALKLYNCNLLHLLLESPNLSGQQLFYIAHSISNAMAAAHELGVAHRDLKSVNVLMEKVGGVWEAAVTDFGLAVIDETKANVSGGAKKSNIKGLSVKYASPEVFSLYYSPNGAKPTFSFAKIADVYSFAVILYELLSGRPAWEGVTDDLVQHKVRSGERPFLPKEAVSAPRPGEGPKDLQCRKMLADLMVLCWNQNPGARPTFHQISSKLSTIDDN